jgi:hypothetical protein
MVAFFRANFSSIWLNIASNEALGVLDTDYLEDYNGVDGHISLVHLESGVFYDVVMTEVQAETPSVLHDYFRGALSLAGIPDGTYDVRCRVRDVVGNYSIIGAVASPIGTERVLSLRLTVRAGNPLRYVADSGPLTVRGGYAVDVRRSGRAIDAIRVAERVDGPGFVRKSRVISAA